MQFDTTSDTATYWNKWTTYPQSKTFAVGYFPIFTNPQKQGIDPQLYDLMINIYAANYLEDWNASGVDDDLRNKIYSSKGFADQGNYKLPGYYYDNLNILRRDPNATSPTIEDMAAKYKEARNAAFQYMATISYQSDFEAWRAYNNSRGGGGFAGVVSGFLSNPINLINPAQALNFAAVQSVTGLTPEQQLEVGAVVGTGVLAAGALGIGGAAAAGSSEAATTVALPELPSLAIPGAGAAVAALGDKAKDAAQNYVEGLLNPQAPTPQTLQPTPQTMETVSEDNQSLSLSMWIGLIGLGLFGFII